MLVVWAACVPFRTCCCSQHGEGDGGTSDDEKEMESLEKSFEAGAKLAKGHRRVCLECFAPEGTPIQVRVCVCVCVRACACVQVAGRRCCARKGALSCLLFYASAGGGVVASPDVLARSFSRWSLHQRSARSAACTNRTHPSHPQLFLRVHVVPDGGSNRCLGSGAG